ncbi:MAG: hypothetical protein MMC33_002451 [Icmadophila ericetorum]|nr:hypothetical protein [Icmadophila ericetorum]
MPYAKSVPALEIVHGSKPDAGDLFDRKKTEIKVEGCNFLLQLLGLLARDETDKEDMRDSNLGTSSMLLYHATVIIQDIFRTNAGDKNISDTSSYLDLSPLYRKGEERLDPTERWSGYRNNLVAAAKTSGEAMQEMYELWKTAAEEKLDEELFQTARLITCGMYINISIHDYLRVLARAHLKDTSWTLDPGKEIPLAVIDPKGVLRGQKNQVSVEFNLLYRFHSSLPRRDVKWTNGFFQDLSKGFVKDEKDRTADGGPYLTLQQLDTFGIQIPVMGAAIAKMYATLPKVEDKGCAKAFPIGLDPLFGGKQGEPMKYRFSRDPETLKFSDVELAKEVVGFNFPLLEIASLNEFRKFFGHPVHQKFTDINQNPEISRKLEILYRDVD